MSDEQRKEEAEVEGHRMKGAHGATDEPRTEDEAEVEGHRMKGAHGMNDEPVAEGESDDEVEAHRLRGS